MCITPTASFSCLIVCPFVNIRFVALQLMKDMLPVGEELMPHRSPPNSLPASQEEPAAYSSQTALPTTPIRKLSRNRGRLVQEESVVEESPENDDAAGTNVVRRSKRKL